MQAENWLPQIMIQTLTIRAADLTLSWSSDLRDLTEFWPTTDMPGDSRCYAFQCADFLRVWCDTIGLARKTKTLFVAVFNKQSRPLALFPLGLEVKHGIKVLTFLDGGMSDYNAPILFPGVEGWGPDVVKAIWNSIRRVCEHDVVVLEKLPDKIGDLTNPLTFLSTSKYPRRGYLVSLTEKWDETASKRLPHWQDSRRQLKRLSNLGTVKFKIATTPEERDDLLEAMIRQKSRRYLDTRGTDSFDRPGYRAFFQEATAVLSRRGSLHLSGLFLDDRILAAHWGYIVGSRYYYMMPSYEGDEWQRYSLVGSCSTCYLNGAPRME